MRRLAPDDGPEASALRNEAQGLLAVLQFWRMNTQASDVRVANVTRVLAFHRRALAYATRKRPAQ